MDGLAAEVDGPEVDGAVTIGNCLDATLVAMGVEYPVAICVEKL